MRDKVRDKDRLEHIINAIDKIMQGADRWSRDEIKSDPILFFGFVKCVEVIGEATYKLTTEFRNNHPDVPWFAMERMRHVLVHGYYTIDPERFFKTIDEDVPALAPIIRAYLEEMSEETADDKCIE